MDAVQIQTILTKIEEFNQLDLEQLLAEGYQGESDLSQVKINQLTAPAFVSLTKRVISQLKAELLAGIGMVLPMSVNAFDDFGAMNLQNDLYNFYNQIKEKQFNSSEAHLLKL